MNQAMPMAVNKVNKLVINTNVDALQKHIIVKVMGDNNSKVTVKLFTQGSEVALTQSTEHQYNFKNIEQEIPYTLQVTIANEVVFTLIEEQTFTDYFDVTKIQTLNIGENGGPQLFEHKILPKGHVEITLLAEPPSFGVFFDGTGNNRTNDIKDSSDDKEPTNIVKLFELYPFQTYQSRYYVEGTGTQANEKDSSLDMGLAFSFDERIKIALDEALDYLKSFKNAKIAFIDVFGFSRGAAQARAFVNQINAITKQKPAYWGGITPVIRFVGLFDSVASIGGDGDNDHSEYYANDELDFPVNLNLASSSAGYVMHLTAFDEKRDKFPLSSLMTNNKQLAANQEEIVLPGVHSDVGGGYSSLETTILYPWQYISGQAGEPEHDRELQLLKESLEKKYFWPTINIEFTARSPRVNRQPKRIRNKSEQTIYTPYKPFWQRNLHNSLPHYGLELMHQKAVSYGVPLQPLSKLAKIKQADGNSLPYLITDELKNCVDAARTAGPESKAWQILYKDYIHHSVKYSGVIDSLAHGPEEDAEYTTQNQQRELFYNQPEQAEKSEQWQSQLINGHPLWTKS